MKNHAVRRMTFTALLSAIAFVATAFIHIPLPSYTGAYFNLGDAVIMFSAIFIDPFAGCLVGIIGASFGDFYAGAAQFVPFTIVAKTLEALAAGYLFKGFKGRWSYSAFYIGGLLMATVYAFSYVILYDWKVMLVSTPFDLLQGLLLAIIATLLIITLKKTKIRSMSEE